jgi:hypothetical protein
MDITSLTATSQIFNALDNSTTYYWRVRGRNPYGDGDWSEVWKFTTASTTSSLLAPVLTAPTDSATGVQLYGGLYWKGVTDAMMYRVQLSKQSDFSTTIYDWQGVGQTQTTFQGLDSNTTYYWRVQANGNSGTSPWSQTWRFTTVTPKPVVLAPTLISPPDGATKLDLIQILTWNQVPLATSYRVQVATASDFGSTLVDRTDLPVGQQILTNLTPATTYYWRAAGMNANGTGPWSPTWNFTTASPSSGVVGATTGGGSSALRLEPNRPNPFSDATTLDFYLPSTAHVTLRLFDLTGRRIAGILDATLEGGSHSVELDMRRSELQGLQPGIYAVQLIANGQTTTRMIELVR